MDMLIKLHTGMYSVKIVDNRYVPKRTGPINRLHSHPVFHLMYIAEGEGTFHIDGLTTEASEGMLYLISPNEPHWFAASCDKPMSNYTSTFVLLDEKGVPGVLSFFDLVEEYSGTKLPETVRKSPVTVPAHLRHAVTDTFRQMIAHQQRLPNGVFDTMRQFDLLIRIIDVMNQIGQAQPGSGRREVQRISVANVLHYMRGNLHRSLTLEELANQIHVTPNYLCRIFKRELGVSPQQYMQSLRIELAMKLLLDTDEPVYEIAAKLGYESASYFSRVFRAEKGITPSEFRELGWI